MKLARIGLPADDPSLVRAKTLHGGEVVSVGSANFDVRSFELNFVTVATVYDKAFASEILKTFKTPLYLIALS